MGNVDAILWCIIGPQQFARAVAANAPQTPNTKERMRRNDCAGAHMAIHQK